MREFYRPFNARLTKLLADERFTWEDVWKSHSQTSKAMRSRWGEDGAKIGEKREEGAKVNQDGANMGEGGAKMTQGGDKMSQS